eukprot:gene27729-37544_t
MGRVPALGGADGGVPAPNPTAAPPTANSWSTEHSRAGDGAAPAPHPSSPSAGTTV